MSVVLKEKPRPRGGSAARAAAGRANTPDNTPGAKPATPAILRSTLLPPGDVRATIKVHPVGP